MRAFLVGALALGIAAAATGSCTLDEDGTAPKLNGPGNTSSGGGEGASNPGTPCTDRAECPADAACVAYACNNGYCTPSFLPEGTEVAGSIQGDCRRVFCSPSGTPTEQPDPADTPAGDDCNVGSCNGATPVLTPKPNESACGMGGLLRCFNGVCVGCVSPSDCLGAECLDPVCNGNMECGTTPKAAGTEVLDTSSTDCTHQECDGAGNVVLVAPDPNDVPDDMLECTNDSCNGVIPQHLDKVDGDGCNSNGGTHCYQGVCSQCGIPANCPDPVCQAPTCNGACGVTNDADGTPCGSGQYCYMGACSQCAVDSNCPAPTGCVASYTCTTGTCVPTYVVDGTGCGNGNKCYGGQCVQCATIADCPAPPDCKLAACINNLCTTSNAQDESVCQTDRTCCGGVCCNSGISDCTGGACQ